MSDKPNSRNGLFAEPLPQTSSEAMCVWGCSEHDTRHSENFEDGGFLFFFPAFQKPKTHDKKVMN